MTRTLHSRSFPPALLLACAAGALAERYQQRRERARAEDPVAVDETTARFVGDIGYRALFDPARGQSDWPLPFVRHSEDLAAVGRTHDLMRETAEPGDIALRWSAAEGRFIQAAVVIEEIRRDEVVTIARVYDASSGSLRGQTVTFRPSRGDRFLRWVELLEASRARAA